METSVIERKSNRLRRAFSVLLALLCLVCALLFGVPGVYQPLWEASSQRSLVHPELTYAPRTLPLSGYSQLPELPNGCEATSLSIVLQYYGYAVDKLEISESYLSTKPLARTWHGYYSGDPALAYCGDAEALGYYCFAGPLCEAANRYLQEQNSTLRAMDLTGQSTYVLKNLVSGGIPVVFWATLDFAAIEKSERTWTILEDGTQYQPYSNLHCLVLYGFDLFYYDVYDPLKGAVRIPRLVFELRFAQMEQRAMCLSHAPLS